MITLIMIMNKEEYKKKCCSEKINDNIDHDNIAVV